ncbi:lamin tail domain-containing protein [candidate division KSB1 bacterium]|nr:lamin tail domain-containing protein [candidate division KSB1 bacterium]
MKRDCGILKPALFLLLPLILNAQSIMINEIMSANGSTVSDENGDYPDWIELFNSGGSSINLEGYGLSDDRLDLKKWVFPNTSLRPNDHLLLFASGKDRAGVINHWETIIRKGDYWKYQIGNASIPSNWIDLLYDDSGWSEGPSGFGYDDGDDATLVPNGTISIFIRKKFVIKDTAAMVNVILHVDYDDAFVAYLNGREIARSNIGIPGNPVSYNQPADGDHEARMYDGGDLEKFDIGNALAYLKNGENVIAIQVHNKSATSSDMSLIPFLSFGLTNIPRDARGSDPVLGLKPSLFHTNFKINSGGESLYLTSRSGQIVDSIKINDIPKDVSFGRKPDGGSDWFLFDKPTPGTVNDSDGYLTTSSMPDFSHTRGFYEAPFDLTLSSESENTVIMFTLDGSKPDRNNGTKYSGAIPISTTSIVRAMAITDQGAGSDVRTHTYIFTKNVIKQDDSGLPASEHSRDHIYWTEEFDMNDVSQSEEEIENALKDIPTISITAAYDSLFGIAGILRGQNLREGSGGLSGDPNDPNWRELVECSVEMIYPENQKFLKYKSWQENSGIKIQGGGGRWNNGYYDHKQSFTLEFKNKYGSGLLKNDILTTAPFNRSSSPGVFDKIILRAGHNKSWGADWDRENTVYTRDQFGRDLQILMSGWGSRGTFVHLYINGKYWGLYNPCERMDDNSLSIYFGGEADDYFFGKGKGGDQAGDNGRFDYLNNTTWTNRQLSELEEYLAVDEYIDMCLLYCYSNPGDGPQYYYGNRNTPPGPAYFTAWDIEDSFEGGSVRTGPPVSIETMVKAGSDQFKAYFNVKNNIDFKMKFADRAYKHCYNDGILTDINAAAVWDSLNRSIEKAILCEIARWGDERGDPYDYQHWLGEWIDVKDDIVYRARKLIIKLQAARMYPRTAPPILKDGDKTITKSILFTESNFQLTIESAVSGGKIYYANDGTDPRKWDLTGNNSSTAVEIAESKTITISDVVILKLRTRKDNEWSPLREIKIIPKIQSGLVINEINYNSAPNFDTEDWVEIYNNSNTNVSLNGWKLTDSNNANIFYFPDGLFIEKENYLVVCHDTVKFKELFPDVDNYVGNIDFKLGNDGDKVRLYKADDIFDIVNYDNVHPWPIARVGNGATLELLHPSLDNSKPENWAASQNHGTPGSINSVYITRVKERQSDPALREFVLYQNFPNPFNRATNICYIMHKPTKVNLSVFDITGKKVSELLNSNQGVGHYKITFEPDNLASGVYFYRLKAGQYSTIKRMLFIK